MQKETLKKQNKIEILDLSYIETDYKDIDIYNFIKALQGLVKMIIKKITHISIKNRKS